MREMSHDAPGTPLTIRCTRDLGGVSLLLDDPDANLRLHIRVESDRHAIDAECLDGLVQVNEALLDVEALRGELIRDVRRGDGAEQLAFLADTRRESQLHFLEALREAGRAVATLVLRRF